MGQIKELKAVDFFIKSEPLTQADRKLISEYIVKNSSKKNKAILTKKKAVGIKKSFVYS